MKSFRIFPAVALLGCLAFSHNSSAAVDPVASVVLLRTSCNDGAGGTLNNCFQSIGALDGWINSTRKPTLSAAKPLLVEIGPGKFVGGFQIDGFGHISFRGAGRDKTVIDGGFVAIPFNVHNAPNLHVENLKATGGFPAPVYWFGTGSSTWVNVHLQHGLYGWTETGCATVTASTNPVHKWWSSTIESAGKVAYLTACSENWFYGSEIIASGPGSVDGLRGITATGPLAEAHIYGSVIRVIPSAGATFPEPFGGGEGGGILAVGASNGGQVHIHGTGIDIVGNEQPNSILALGAASGGTIHASQSAFNLSTATGGTVYRIKNDGGHIHAAYLWEEHSTPPNITSQDGADMAVVTTPGGTPRMVVYSTACASKWFDVGANACRP